MIIPGVDSGDFIRTLLTLSAAYMDRLQLWKSEYMPKFHDGVTSETKTALKDPFDFIVVGSGYAGSLLASKLARAGCFRVLLLEEGPAPGFGSSIPFLKSLNASHFMREASTVPQLHGARASRRRSAKLKLAKGLGGSSLIDSGMFFPENVADFDNWGLQYRLPEWNAEKMQDHLIEAGIAIDGEELVNITNPTAEERDMLRKIMERVRRRNPLSFLWLEAGRELQYPMHNGIDKKLYEEGGFFIPQVSTSGGFLMTPVSKFIKEAGDNLVVVTNAEVTKLLYAPSRMEVSGVKFRDVKTGKEFMARAGREVLLTAGAVGTAKILLQSGIGPADHLREMGIALIRNLGVGVVLRDRVRVDLFAKMRPLFSKHLRDKLMEMDQFEQYFREGTGLLATPYAFGSALLKSRTHGEPDVLVEARPIGLLGQREMVESLSMDNTTFQTLDPNHELFSEGGMQISLTILRPFSVGNMWLRKQDDGTFAAKVNPNYLGDRRDISALVQAIRFVENIMSTEYMKLLEARLLTPDFTEGNCTGGERPSEQYWRCYIRQMSKSGDHLTSTAAMNRVTTPELKVIHMRHLRVVDESAFPSPVNGGAHSSAMVVVRKAVDMILKDNRNFDCPIRRLLAFD